MIKELSVKLLRSKPFRFLMTAGIATIVDVSVYFIMFNFVIDKQNLELGQFVVGAPTLSLVVSFSCGLVTNFILTKTFVFNTSDLRSSVQFGRFVLVAIAVFFSNYYLMNFLIKVLDWYPTLSRGFSAVSIGVLSFLTHKTFSFRTKS